MTNGKTLTQLRNKFNFTGTDAEIFDTYVAYQESLTKSARRSTFIVANKLYVHNAYKVNEKFQETATQKLQTDVEMIDFTNQIKAAETINNFTEIEPAQLNNYPRVILMNTIYMNVNFEKVI